ncbi:MAG TPA: flagellar FlbD family protein [Dehalococcoidia bacterium]|nr:flagellar FlbD family protein [Dehalococcoidia bacterium]
MIKLTRLDGSELYVNAEFIQSVESTPDTHIILLNGHSYVVTEGDDDVVERIIEYRRAAALPAAPGPGARYAADGSTGGAGATDGGHLRVVED